MTSNGDVFTGIAGILTGLSGLLNPIKELNDLIATIRKGSQIKIKYTPKGPKDNPTDAGFELEGVRAKELKKVIAQLEGWSKEKHAMKSGLEAQNAAVSFEEDPNAEKFIKEHSE